MWLATDHVICVSGDTYERMGRSAFRREDLRMVRNGVDKHHYRPVREQEAAQVREQLLPPMLRDRLVIGSNAGARRSTRTGWTWCRPWRRCPRDCAGRWRS